MMLGWRDLVSDARSEVIDDLAYIVAGKRLRERIAELRAEIARIEAPRAQVVKDRDALKEQWEAEKEKHGVRVDRFNQKARTLKPEKLREANAVLTKQGIKCRELDDDYVKNNNLVILIDRKAGELRPELESLEFVVVPEPKHLELIRRVLNE